MLTKDIGAGWDFIEQMTSQAQEGAMNRPVAFIPVVTALRALRRRRVPARAGVLAAQLRARKVVQALLHGVVVRLGNEQRRRLLRCLCWRCLSRLRGCCRLSCGQASILRLKERVRYICGSQRLQTVRSAGQHC